MEAPSFSLGLDLDAEPEPFLPTHIHQPHHFTPNPAPDPSSSTPFYDDGEDTGLLVADSDPESGPDQPRVLKRLKRGGSETEESRAKKKDKELEAVCCDNGDDDIEAFSSEEQDLVFRDAPPSTQYNSMCSSSKVTLRGSGVLTGQSLNRRKAKENGLVSGNPASSSLSTGPGGFVFPKLTVSPLRKFQLVDSDSDSDSDGGEQSIKDYVSRKSQKLDWSLNKQPSTRSEHKNQILLEKQKNEDLWKDFCPESFHIPTPALDEVCNEYFQGIRNKNAVQKPGSDLCTSSSIGCRNINSMGGLEQCWNRPGPLPPSYRYFFHEDPRIQKLVRSRLPNFLPLGVVNNSKNQHPSESDIDYMSQFNGGASKQMVTQRNTTEKGKSSTRGRNNSKKSNTKQVPRTSQEWIEPRSTKTAPKDAGRRRVRANGQAAGHWYTSPEGGKVYVSRNGQELTGQLAYRLYRKENRGFRKSKKKTAAKKKKG